MSKKTHSSADVHELAMCLVDGLMYLNDEAFAEEFESDDRTYRVNLTMPTDPEYESDGQYGFISIGFGADGSLDIVLQGLTRKGKQLTLQATAPSFTLTAKKVKASDYPGF